MRYTTNPTLRERLAPGGWAARLFEAVEAGELAHEKCLVMLNDWLEMRVVSEALLDRVERFELVAMERALNNMLRGMARLGVRVS